MVHKFIYNLCQQCIVNPAKLEFTTIDCIHERLVHGYSSFTKQALNSHPLSPSGDIVITGSPASMPCKRAQMNFHENANLALMLWDFNARVLWYFLAIASLSPNIVVRPVANNLKTLVKQLHRLESSLSSNYKKTYLEKKFIWQSWYKCCSRHCDSCLFFFCSCKHRLVESVLRQTP